MDPEIIELKITIARILERLEHMAKTLEEQDKLLATQGTQIAKLISLADQGRGSVWMLITVGGFVGMIISNAKNILKFFAG